MADYTLRTLLEEDIPAAMDLVWRVFEEFEASKYCAQGIAEFQAFIDYDTVRQGMRQKKLALWGCYMGGDIVGVLALRNLNHICLLFVDKRYHCRGIAKSLLEQVLLTLDDSVREINVHSSLYAVDIYRRMGFCATDAEQNVNGIRFIPMTRGL